MTGGGEEEKKGGEAPAKNDSQAGGLLAEAASLLKTLRSMKKVRLKQVSAGLGGTAHDRFALLDGGATHALRMAHPHERDDLHPIEVELAQGTTTLFCHPGHSTSLTEVEPIMPLSLLVEKGFKISWRRTGCVRHPELGDVKCWHRNGWRVMDRCSALQMLEQFEAEEACASSLSESQASWWTSRFPQVPPEALKYMMGQGEEAQNPPWNRRARRSHARAKGVVVNLFSGPHPERWRGIGGNSYAWIHVDTCLGSQYSLHSPQVWAFLWSQATKGHIAAVLGGPPCRTVSRMRNRKPGPRRLRGRDEL